ncbi:MAG: DoxX family protein [Rhodanobacteraceae bacterium]|nr:MAG: DoxX family protein [Rhodanobacteraceae bacterium]
MHQAHNAATLLGRIFLIALYAWSGISKIGHFGFFEHYAATGGVSGPLLIASIVIELGGSLLLLAGYRTRIAALILAVYSVAAILLFYGIHPAGLQAQIIAFAELAAAGGFLVLVGSGAGDWSLDALLARRHAKGKAA